MGRRQLQRTRLCDKPVSAVLHLQQWLGADDQEQQWSYGAFQRRGGGPWPWSAQQLLGHSGSCLQQARSCFDVMMICACMVCQVICAIHLQPLHPSAFYAPAHPLFASSLTDTPSHFCPPCWLLQQPGWQGLDGHHPLRPWAVGGHDRPHQHGPGQQPAHRLSTSSHQVRTTAEQCVSGLRSSCCQIAVIQALPAC